jgi:hypothetical protein
VRLAKRLEAERLNLLHLGDRILRAAGLPPHLDGVAVRWVDVGMTHVPAATIRSMASSSVKTMCSIVSAPAVIAMR